MTLNDQYSNAGVRLSPRLEAVASYVPEGAAVADIGTDHGYIPIYLLEAGRAVKALAMDVGTGPLNRAREHAAAMEPQLRERIELRLSDGLKELKPGEADTVVIAGMGGDLMIRILTQGQHMWGSVKNWVLSPQSELDRVRLFLVQNHFCICRENMVKDSGKFYTVMDVKPGIMEDLSEEEYLYGPCLLRDQNQVLLEYLDQEEKRISKIVQELSGCSRKEKTDGQIAALAHLKGQLSLIKLARERMGAQKI